MKKTINFNKGFLPAAIFSCVIIALGIVGFCVKGINLGLDFRPAHLLLAVLRLPLCIRDKLRNVRGVINVSCNFAASRLPRSDALIAGLGHDYGV